MKQKFSILLFLLLLWFTGSQAVAQNAPNPFDIEQPSLRVFLPAPELAESFTLGGVPTYSIYTVSAYAPGYFRQESTDVPVFPGITSLQQFNLIPMPLYADGESDTAPPYSNQEPQF